MLDEFGRGYPPDLIHLCRFGADVVVDTSDDDVVEFVFCEPGLGVCGGVDDAAYRLQISRTDTELVLAPASSGVDDPLARHRVPAAAIGPQSSKMVFREGPTLKKHPPITRNEEQRERTMQQTCVPMCVELVRGPHRDIVRIDQHNQRHLAPYLQLIGLHWDRQDFRLHMAVSPSTQTPPGGSPNASR